MWCFRLVGVSIVSVLIWLKTVRKDVIVADVKVVIFVNIFSRCMSTLLQLYLRVLGIMSVLIRKKMTNPSVSQGPSFPVWSVKIGSNKAALNSIVAARVINPQTGKSKLVYRQQDGGSQLDNNFE